MKDDVRTHGIASLAAGTVATTVCAPADVLKSRIQSASSQGGNSVRSPPIRILTYPLAFDAIEILLTFHRNELVHLADCAGRSERGRSTVSHEGMAASLAEINTSHGTDVCVHGTAETSHPMEDASHGRQTSCWGGDCHQGRGCAMINREQRISM